ncbi:hypothetical protein GCM10010112_67380 [Actinoplanes lobatus]|uniref:non-specific serine/threonine protein kinase n=1 Tax=Actinoplanes lobatus TaxID=113568 RepID=A0A7W7MI12_9ACTN|nr:hypothetical protein [Actinoplanes lobatus]MBB4750933.1 serine/threonine-protein kinase [Actinoplanes lobatus]GGN86166.1 hypothetical protein GCM10010112_67380 [Actinoplanes lobatus]GIE43507.1 hypothetical protein Alo02nite_64050 [Actinoplanes lobatus]
MAPEQWTGAPATPACDIYAATATFFECLTGRPPYDGANLFALHDQHANAPIPTDPAPAPVHDLLRQGMAKQPADRPQHAVAFLDILERVAGAAYGPDWEDRGLRELARRAALLAMLWPFPDQAGNATSLASTALGSGAATGRRSRKVTVFAAAAVVATLVIGGAGYRFAAADDVSPVIAAGEAGSPTAAAPASTEPSGTIPPAASATPTTVAPTTESPETPDATTGPTPTTAPTTRSPSTPATTSAPSPSVSTSPTPPPDTVAPTVGAVRASPTALESEKCTYGNRSSTVTATVTDDVSGAADLKVTFRYTLNGATSTVAMSSAGRNLFRGTLTSLPMPKVATRIPITVVAVDAAGNSGSSASPVYVTLDNICTPG